VNTPSANDPTDAQTNIIRFNVSIISAHFRSRSAQFCLARRARCNPHTAPLTTILAENRCALTLISIAK
jgi:hypothetical protein